MSRCGNNLQGRARLHRHRHDAGFLGDLRHLSAHHVQPGRVFGGRGRQGTPNGNRAFGVTVLGQFQADVELRARLGRVDRLAGLVAGTVTEIRRGEAIANVVLDVAGPRLVASITVEAVDELGLTEGTNVTAIVKASDVIIATD